MALRFYLDTATWMDFYEDRKYPLKDTGKVAFSLLCKLLKSDCKIAISDFSEKELESFYSIEEIRGMLMLFDKFLVKIVATDRQIDEARIIAGQRNLPRGDAIHAIIARDSDAVLVTRDRHFNSLKDICSVISPEELI
jgi:predicted nucleic acid-binding protein